MDAAVRRRLVNLSVATTSAAALALSWAGIVAADREAEQAQTVIVAPAEQPVAAGAQVGSGDLVPAPSPTRRIVVVRQSRAS